ncbi:MAG: hypothetical protein GF308_14220 [Candidatus Heimdallarchaeota archaeon]|nr:hypothetical protein [Candidatus Heimdallarchaeota archaeon]
MFDPKLIVLIITIPCGFLASLTIYNRNRKNLTNILIAIIVFIGAVLGSLFSLLKQAIYPYNPFVSKIFAILLNTSFISIAIPSSIFSIHFWKLKNKSIPQFIYFLTPIPVIILTGWIIINPQVIELVVHSYNTIDTLFSPVYSITTGIYLFVTFSVFLAELGYIAHSSKSYPRLRRRMIIFTIFLSIGLYGAIFSMLFFSFFVRDYPQPTALFVIFSAICITFISVKTISVQQFTLWHSCPKLLIEKDGTAFCLNVDRAPREITVVDLGGIIEEIQIDKNVLKTERNNCSNIVFSNDEGIVCCLTTHEPIKVLDEVVKEDEMELARTMEIMQDKGLCAECLHKIIAYRKEHKEMTDSEIRKIFLGLRAEDFFGVA